MKVLIVEPGKEPYSKEITGTFFLCAAPAGSEDFESLNEEQVEKYGALFHSPEVFLNMGGHIVCLPAEGLSQ